MSVMNDIKNKKYINQDLLVYFFSLDTAVCRVFKIRLKYIPAFCLNFVIIINFLERDNR